MLSKADYCLKLMTADYGNWAKIPPLANQPMGPRQRLIFTFGIVVGDVEVPQLIHISILVVGNHSKPIPDVMLLQILLRQVFQVPGATDR